jgi:hypothetical protein
VYKRQNTSKAIAAGGVIREAMVVPAPNNTVKEETMLSFASNPETSDVTMRQSPKPRGEKAGDSHPADNASMLSLDAPTI